jgi:hypothetical protein
MSIAEAAKFVASAYAIILAVFVAYYFISARRVSTLRRDVELLEEEMGRRRAGGEAAGRARGEAGGS